MLNSNQIAQSLGFALGQNEVDWDNAMLVIEEMAFDMTKNFGFELSKFCEIAREAYINRRNELEDDESFTWGQKEDDTPAFLRKQTD